MSPTWRNLHTDRVSLEVLQDPKLLEHLNSFKDATPLPPDQAAFRLDDADVVTRKKVIRRKRVPSFKSLVICHQNRLETEPIIGPCPSTPSRTPSHPAHPAFGAMA